MTTETTDYLVVTPIDGFSPETPLLQYWQESTGAANSQLQLMFKSSDQAWIYTLE